MIKILTLSWNGLDKLKRLRPGLMANMEKLNQPFIWYIRDNGSTDGTVEEISRWDRVKVLAIDHNRDNFAQGMNSLREESGKVVYKTRAVGMTNIYTEPYLLLNNDVVFGDTVSIKNMYDLLCSSYTIEIVGARLLYPDSNTLQHAGTIFGTRYGNMPYHYRHKEESNRNAEKNRYFQAVTAAVCLVRQYSMDKIGIDGFDNRYHWAFCDVDLNLRIGEGNTNNIAYCGQTKIYHEESASLIKNPVNKLFMNHNVKLFRNRWFGKYTIDHDLYLNDPHYNEIR